MVTTMMVSNTFARIRRELRLTILPITWKDKYPRVYFVRWIVVGSIVAVLTGNAPIKKLNPLNKGGRAEATSAMGQTAVSIATYPLPLTIAVTRWGGTEANHVCTVLKINCDINPSRNLHYKLRTPFVKTP